MLSLKLNKSDYKLVWVFTIFGVIWLILKFWTEKHPIGQILFDIPIIIAKTLAGFFIVRWLIQYYIIERKQYFLFFVLATSALIVTGFVDLLRDYFGTGHTWKDLPSIGYILIHSFYYSAADLSAPFIIVITKKYFENQTSLAKVREQQKESELKLLRTQLNPHFLFNNLNTVDALICSDPLKAREYISKLSSLYRYLISNKDNDIISLEEEINMVKDYFYLIQTRFGNAYKFRILPHSQSILNNNFYLPTGALQTLFENVVKHNKIVQKRSIDIELLIKSEVLVFTNNKSSDRTNLESFGIGLNNLKERYELLLGKTIIIEDTENYFTVSLPLVTLKT
ncbi:sensor histidine kinase [Aquimarina sp. 2201CG5-10]|uniref:sensor histidine kinase n=1 Tax=Aquimarina callyspongiae TaxID=3098150 RepID=UPI002AB4FB5B|nr:histidine kinase [Aquimarina sp. 2201CG5-10]MDY8135892.1 histidine kinase [Aquimarina sp. 2201CG5-10]